MKEDRPFSERGKRGVSRRDFMGGAVAFGLGAAFSKPALASMSPAPAGIEPSVPGIAARDGRFKILQITDSHMGYVLVGVLKNPELREHLHSLKEKFQPDLIVNTGDFWANKTDAKADTCKALCMEYAKLKTPWAFAWGNHDESTDYNRTHAMLEKAPHSLYRGLAADGNYRIAVTDGDDGRTAWSLILLNNSRGGFKEEQIQWFQAEAEKIKKETPVPPPALLFFHIPLPQYDDLAAQGKAVGVKFETVCHENGSRDAFSAFRASGFVKGMFCGHDHVNDYYGNMEGIRLQYGRALGGYGADKVRKGATLITIDLSGASFETASVFPDGTSVAYDRLITEQEPGRIY